MKCLLSTVHTVAGCEWLKSVVKFKSIFWLKVSLFKSENATSFHSFYLYFYQELSNPLPFAHCACNFLKLKYQSFNLTKKRQLILYIVGLALDYCVFYSAKDAIGYGFKVYVVEDATRGISPEGISNAKQDMKDSGIKIIQSSEILGSSSQFLRSSSTIIFLVTMLPLFLKDI